MLSSPEHKSYYNTALSKMQAFFAKIFNFFQQKNPRTFMQGFYNYPMLFLSVTKAFADKNYFNARRRSVHGAAFAGG